VEALIFKVKDRHFWKNTLHFRNHRIKEGVASSYWRGLATAAWRGLLGWFNVVVEEAGLRVLITSWLSGR
jgi:hypothetical protein